MKIKILSIILISFMLVSAKSKNDELFNGESLLNECLLNIPLTYSKKNDKIVALSAKNLNGKELILLRFDKKTKKITFKRYYLISEVGKDDKTIFNFLVATKDYENFLKGNKSITFLKFRPKYDRFYLSECFDKIMTKHVDLLNQWEEK